MVGTVTISIEVELGWGYHDIESKHRYASLSDERERETNTLYRLLERLDDHDIPITFDVVGHLFLDSCAGHHEGPYPDGWFDEDPGTDVDTDPLFYAPDLVDAIDAAETEHEICTHTFSHVLCNEMSEETIRADIENSIERHSERLGEEPVSIVTPRHRDIPRSVLRDCGIDVVRVPADDLPDHRLARLYWYLFGRHPVVDPTEEKGVIESPTSTAMSLTAFHLPRGQRRPHPVFRVIPERFRRSLQRRYLDDALRRVSEENSHIHLWTHLHDLSNESQWKPVSNFLNSLEGAVSSGEVQIARMEDLAAEPPRGDSA